MQWRRRKRGTPNQIGQAFPLERQSMQHKKRLLPKLRGLSKSEQYKALADVYNKVTKPKTDKLMESEILAPEDIEYL